MIYKITLLLCSPLIVWVFYNMLKDFKFSRHFLFQTLRCLKCISFWITFVSSVLITKELLYSLCLGSVVSYAVFRMDEKSNRDANNNIKL